MAKHRPEAATSIQIGPCSLVYTPTTAQMLNSSGVQVWALAETMFPPAQAGVPPVVSVIVKTTKRVIHPPPPANDAAVKSGNIAGGATSSPVPATTITITTIAITLTGSRFAGTNLSADCSLSIRQSSNSDDDTGPGLPVVTYSQTFGGLSYYGEDDDFTGYFTTTAPLPAGSLSLPQSGTLELSAGTSASVNLAPGYVSFYSATGGVAIATGSAPALGTIAPTSLTISATEGISDVFGFPPPAPPYQINLSFDQAGGWLVPLPDSSAGIGTLSAVAAANYDTAVLAVGEDTAGNITFMASLSLELAPDPTNQTQYNLALAPGLALVGDPTLAPVQATLNACELLINFATTPPGLQITGNLGIASPGPFTTGSFALWPVTGASIGPCTLQFAPLTVGAPLVQEAFMGLLQALCSLPDALTRPLTFNSYLGVALVTATPFATADYASYVILGGTAPGTTQAFLTGLNLEVTRPADMMVASFSFFNCGIAQLSDGTLEFAQWVSNQGDSSVRMTVTLPPQHISECAYPLNDDNSPRGTLGPVPVPARMAAATSLMLELPVQGPLPLSAATLLDWTQYTLLSPQNLLAVPPDPSQVTSLELPYKLMLALEGHAGWVQPPPPSPAASASPMWHARLGEQEQRADGTGNFVNERSSVDLTARAPWSWDMTSTQLIQVFADEALTPQDREYIVSETEQAANPGTEISIDHLILSPLGAWADLRLVSPGSPLVAWTQIISQGRDQYIRAVNVGYLLPWGHVASVIEVAERRFCDDAGNTAYLSIKEYLVVGEVTRTYTQQPNGTPMLRDAVLTQVDLLTQITPAIDQTSGAITVPGDTTGPAFVPYVNGQPFLFHARVYDGDHLAQPPRKTADTYLAAIFVAAKSSQNLITAALNAFNSGTTTPQTTRVTPHTDPLPTGLLPGQVSPLSTALMNGQKLALATSHAPGDTTHAITSLSMQVSSLVPAGTPWNLAAPISNFYPSLNQAQISLPAVNMLTSGAGLLTSDVAVSYLPEYLNPATSGSNPVDAYMGLASPIAATLSGAKANGLIAPALAFSGLSRTFGALVGDPGNLAAPLANLLAGKLDPSTFFPSGAKLLNLISFSDLVGELEGLRSFDTTHLPQVKVDTSDPTKVVATMNWLPTLWWPPQLSASGNGLTNGGATISSTPNTWNVPGGFVSLTLNGDLAGSLTLNSTITTPITTPIMPGPLPAPVANPIPAGVPVSTMVAIVNDFTVNVLGLVNINFDTLTFASTTGKKPTVNVSLSSTPFVLTGQIDFLQILFEAIEQLFASGPSISIDDAAITLSFEFAVPDLGMGIFDLSGIAIGVDVILSLTTDPVEFHFHYAGPDNPFDLAVDLLGGGGYFLVDASDLANTSITLSAQAGASVSLDLGVASGSVSIMLGAFFQSSSTSGQGPLLGGYVRADGQLNVLGLISLHVSFYLGVTYAPEAGILWGECTVTVEVSVLFFHQSVSLSMRKQFPVKLPSVPLLEHVRPLDALPPWPIPRDQIMGASDWMTYTQAFA